MVASELRVCYLLFIALLLLSSCGVAQPQSASYIDAFGTYTAVADRLAALVGAEEPLQPADIARLTSEVRRVCAAGASSATPKYHLAVPDLVKHYSKGKEGVFDQRAVEQACAAIMACQLDESCSLSDAATATAAAGGLEDPGSVPVTGMLRLLAALALFLEGLAGVYIPVLLRSVEGYEWWLSLLNCFSGGVFLAAGLVHLLPHCAEAQARLGSLIGDYPLYLVLITLGYMLVLFVERVLFDVHGSAHGHGPHTGIAPPCVDCRTAEVLLSSDEDSGGEEGSQQHQHQHQQEQGPVNGHGDAADGAANGVGGQQRRYNLRSRTAAPAHGEDHALLDGSSAAAAGLSKPLLADDEADAAHQAAAGSGGGCGHEHHHHIGHAHAHAHAHDHSHHGGGLHEHGSHSQGHRHVAPVHHHAVVVGDLRQGVVLLVAMAIHTFLECMALGLMDMRKEFLVLFMAIASHKLISGLALSSRFLKEGATTRQITLYVGPFVFVAPSAILAGMFVRDVHPMVSLTLSCFATGTFLYVGASEIVEEEFEGDMRSGRTDISQVFARWCKFAMLLLGVGSIALLSLIPDAHDHGGVGHGDFGGSHHHHHHHHH